MFHLQLGLVGMLLVLADPEAGGCYSNASIDGASFRNQIKPLRISTR